MYFKPPFAIFVILAMALTEVTFVGVDARAIIQRNQAVKPVTNTQSREVLYGESTPDKAGIASVERRKLPERSAFVHDFNPTQSTDGFDKKVVSDNTNAVERRKLPERNAFVHDFNPTQSTDGFDKKVASDNNNAVERRKLPERSPFVHDFNPTQSTDGLGKADFDTDV